MTGGARGVVATLSVLLLGAALIVLVAQDDDRERRLRAGPANEAHVIVVDPATADPFLGPPPDLGVIAPSYSGPAFVVRVAGEGVATDLYVFDGDGRPPRRLGIPGGLMRDPTWAPDGSRLVLTFGGTGTGNDNLAVVNVNGSGFETLSVAGFDSPSTASWSPDGRRLAFAAFVPATVSNARGSQALVANADGTNPQVIPPGADPTASYGPPVWSPDSSQVAFGCDRGGPQVCVCRPDGSDLRTFPVGTNYGISWSPDGRHLATGGWEDCQGLFVVDLKEEKVSKVDDGAAAWVEWSPDGEHISFVDLIGEDLPGVILRPDGSGRVEYGRASEPVWTPDGEVLFRYWTDGVIHHEQLRLIRPDGSGLRAITYTDYTYEDAAFAPPVSRK